VAALVISPFAHTHRVDFCLRQRQLHELTGAGVADVPAFADRIQRPPKLQRLFFIIHRLSGWGVMPAMCTDREAMSTERNHQGLSNQLLRSDPIVAWFARSMRSPCKQILRTQRISCGYSFEFGIEPSPGRADTGNLEQDLPEVIVAVAEAAQQRNSAIALLLDEVQYLTRSELAALVVACHEIAQRGLPFMFIGAGLPQTAALAGNAKSYAERLFNYPQMGPLESDAAQAALVHPAEQEGVRFQDAALGVETANISNVRQQLIDKGMIWSQRYGETAFTVPMLIRS
jgi:hypothetical protein